MFLIQGLLQFWVKEKNIHTCFSTKCLFFFFPFNFREGSVWRDGRLRWVSCKKEAQQVKSDHMTLESAAALLLHFKSCDDVQFCFLSGLKNVWPEQRWRWIGVLHLSLRAVSPVCECTCWRRGSVLTSCAVGSNIAIMVKNQPLTLLLCVFRTDCDLPEGHYPTEQWQQRVQTYGRISWQTVRSALSCLWPHLSLSAGKTSPDAHYQISAVIIGVVMSCFKSAKHNSSPPGSDWSWVFDAFTWGSTSLGESGCWLVQHKTWLEDWRFQSHL